MTRFGKVVKLKGFKPFTSAANALGEINQISDSICSDDLKNFLEMNLPKVKDAKKAKFQLGVSDPKLGNSIVEATNIPCVCNDHIGEIIRGCRTHFSRFIKAGHQKKYQKETKNKSPVARRVSTRLVSCFVHYPLDVKY